MEKLEPIRHERGRPMLLAGLRRQHAYTASAERTIAEQWQQFRLLSQVPGQVGTTVYGVMCGHDGGGFEYMCGVEVESFEGLPVGLGRMRILEQDYAVFLHRGHISTIRTTWESILHEWFPRSGYASAHKPDFEVYDRRFAPDSGEGDFEIWISIFPKQSAAGG